MKNITFHNIPDEINTVEKTIDYLKRKFRNSEEFEVTIEEHVLCKNEKEQGIGLVAGLRIRSKIKP